MLGVLRGAFGRALSPVARLLLRLGLSPSAVTILGTLGVVGSALALFPGGHWVMGTVLVGVFLLCDGLDGTMARESGRQSRFGAFLDSTMDRLADGAVFVAIAWGCAISGDRVGAGLAAAVLVLGFVVSYARARADVEGWDASAGVVERTDRLVVSLAGVLAFGLGMPVWVLWVSLGVVALGSAVTVLQRVSAAHRASAME
ncbi:phosphatidylinositol phosphate synthase [Tessaracoccus antarcticus]|uniref:phosphatidylinositol phosphate synthase n=1 Tax=Tessaracoccus antarcticus TaxID=2479848 RepID=UPI0018F7B967|nr:CDP-alcohol phosphatidyltransferase family protein [Tessaracoccus antarcticus]